MKPNSVNSYLFFSLNVEFIAPEFMKLEFNKYKEECLFKSMLSEHEFEIRQTEVESNIEFFKESKYDELLIKAVKNLPDPKDSPYLALSLSTNSPIWSNDPHFKQQPLVKVFTTAELINNLLKGKL
jgi:predicted nucleic acid-binding protein